MAQPKPAEAKLLTEWQRTHLRLSIRSLLRDLDALREVNHGLDPIFEHLAAIATAAKEQVA